MHYKRKAHRGRGKRNTMDNQGCRVHGNSISKQGYYSWKGAKAPIHTAKQIRNRVAFAELD